MQKYHNYNQKDKWYAVGIMSGTSCDGLDLVLCTFKVTNNKWEFEILDGTTTDYPDELRAKLVNVTKLSSEELAELDVSFGTFIGRNIRQFLSDSEFVPDLIACHGHTVFHQPDKNFTMQIGNGEAIMNEIQLPVINDFRSLDVFLGGQGAPLVPLGDMELFGEYDFCLNLGGISNVSFDKNGVRVAYDISPANLILNHLAGMADLPYDMDGLLATAGKQSEALFDSLNKCTYYSEEPPKSLGIERIRLEFFPLLQSALPLKDKIRTCVNHIAYQINKEILNTIDSENITSPAKVLVTGGGAKNPALTEALTRYSQNTVQYLLPEVQIVDYKEALIFGF
ncbi:anhydro-N-acetylmuramic acid kinase, partial [Bacteroidota bacterium]